jgi:hypothetical protein
MAREWGFKIPGSEVPDVWYVTRNPLLAETMLSGAASQGAIMFVRDIETEWALADRVEE